tara:strand:+ start:175 stop:639 length:465 start_codon:yes stop_codon:yes gene_type:complete
MKHYPFNPYYVKGSVLIEALISITFVSIGALALMNLQSQLIKSKALTQQNSSAIQIAQDRIETLRNYSSSNDFNQIISGSDSLTGLNTTYESTWTISNMSNPSYKNLTVNVSWQRSDSTQSQLTLNSNIGKLSPVLSGLAMRNIVPPPPALTPP